MVKIKIVKKFSVGLLRSINLLMGQMSLSAVRPRPMTAAILKFFLSQKGVYFFTAVADIKGREKIIGALTVYFVRIPSGLICIAEDLIVDELYRKWGIGRILMEGGVALAREKRARHISLRTNPKRVDAMKLYEALGFKRRATNFYRINLYR